MSKRQRTLHAGRRVYRILDEDDPINFESVDIQFKNDKKISADFQIDKNNNAIVFPAPIGNSNEKVKLTYNVEETNDETK